MQKVKYDKDSDRNSYLRLFFLYHLRFIVNLNMKGKRLKALNRFLLIKQLLKEEGEGYKVSPNDIFFFGVLCVTPVIFLRMKYIGGIKREIPFPITEFSRIKFSCK
jgi:hypothetical protein